MVIADVFQIVSVNLHTYGAIVGFAIVVGITLIENQYKKLGYSEDCFWKIGFLSLFFGIIGARLWHVGTDFYLYKNNLSDIFSIWNGGLSILGAVFGGVTGLYLALRFFPWVFSLFGVRQVNDCKKLTLFSLLDIAVFGLPFGQAIGRVGNYVNQELYGLPTDFFMKIFIDEGHRLSGFENIEHYHPLFFYEMVAMVVFGGIVHYLNSQKKLPKIGRGKLFLIYVLYYSAVRFVLDFLRIDKAIIGEIGIGVNQLLLIFVVILASYLVFNKNEEKK